MITPDQLEQAIFRRRDEKLAAAIIASKAAGIYNATAGKLGSITRENFCRSITVDAAEVIGIPLDMLDLSRESHVRLLTKIAVALILDEIEAAPGSTDNPLSSYSQKS